MNPIPNIGLRKDSALENIDNAIYIIENSETLKNCLNTDTVFDTLDYLKDLKASITNQFPNASCLLLIGAY